MCKTTDKSETSFELVIVRAVGGYQQQWEVTSGWRESLGELVQGYGAYSLFRSLTSSLFFPFVQRFHPVC